MTFDELMAESNSKQRKRPSDNEHRIQCACIKLFRYLYPHYIIYAIPNGGQRNAIVAAKLKAEGVLAGIPDIHIPMARNGYHSLYIEMKNGKAGRLSDAQKEMHTRLQDYGNKVAVCRNTKEFINTINEYLNENENV
jgi:hypothetical protein